MLFRTVSESAAYDYINKKTGGHSGWYVDIGQ
jgi:hypothetical protein